MSSLIIALDLGRNHIQATLVRLGQLSQEENLSIERNVFYMRSFDDCVRNDPRLLVSNWMNCLDDLIRDFIEYYQDNDRIISIACSLSNSLDYQQDLSQNDSILLNKYTTFFGLNLRLLIQSALRDLILRWEEKPYIKYYTPPTSPRGTLSYLSEQAKPQTIFSIPPALIYDEKLQSTDQKIKDYCGSQESTDNQLDSSSDEHEQIDSSPISFKYPPRLFSIIQHLADIPISFSNQTKCFALGELSKFSDENYDRILALTLGTHFGSTFIDQGRILQNRDDIPPNGTLSNCRFDESTSADDCFSTRGLINIYIQLIRRAPRVFDGYSLAQQATNGDRDAIQTFELFAQRLGQFLCPFIDKFRPNLLLIGGGLAQSWYLIESELKQTLTKFSQMEIYFNVSNEKSICFGAIRQQISTIIRYKYQLIRQTNQTLLPVTKVINTNSTFDINPCHEIPIGYISVGYKKLNEKLYRLLQESHILLIDGFIGIDFDEFANELNKFYFQQTQYSKSRTLMFYSTQVFLQIHSNSKDRTQIKSLKDLIDFKRLNYLKINLSYPCVIIGPGASFVNELSPLVYIDLSRNELRYRLSAQKSSYENQLISLLYDINYRHSYDYPIFNQYKQELISRIDFFIDGQRPNCPTWLDGSTFRQALAYTSNQIVHLRPSLHFDCGIILSDYEQHLVEFSSDILYSLHVNQILGNDFHRRFLTESKQFPIQIRLLNPTIDRINSKVHRAYYRVRTKQQLKENSFINYQDVIDSKTSTQNKPLKYIPSNIHEFFFSFNENTTDIQKETDRILEISMAVDNSIKPRQFLCIDETKQQPCRPISIQIEPEHYNEQHLPTPEFYIYDVHRLIIKTDRTDDIIRLTENRFHLCILVEGDAIEIEYYSFDNYRQKQIRQYNQWQTFLIPGSIDKYSLRPIVKTANKFDYFLLLIIFLKWNL